MWDGVGIAVTVLVVQVRGDRGVVAILAQVAILGCLSWLSSSLLTLGSGGIALALAVFFWTFYPRWWIVD